MKKYLLVLLILGLFTLPAMAKDYTVNVTIGNWNGLDSNGVAEASLPATIKVHDAATGAVLSQVNVSGAVTNYAMPSYTISVPDNTSKTHTVYATVTDSLGNSSAPSPNSNTVTLVGNDTSAPAGINTITITVQ